MRDSLAIAMLVCERTPDTLTTSSGHLWAIPEGERAFLVTVNPYPAPLYGPAHFKQALESARANQWTAFVAGRFIIHVVNNAWDDPLLVQELLQALVDSQYQRLPAPGQREGRIRRRIRGWIRGMFTAERALPDGALPVQPAPADESAPALSSPQAAD
jgi:hypothetical protein